MSCCTHCDDAGCRRCDPHLAAEAAGGEQGLTTVELELVAVRNNLRVAQQQVRDLSAALAAERAQVGALARERDAAQAEVADVRFALRNFALNGGDAPTQIRGIYADLDEATARMREHRTEAEALRAQVASLTEACTAATEEAARLGAERDELDEYIADAAETLVQAVRAEREACAAMAEACIRDQCSPGYIAAAIRARGGR